MRVLFSRTGSSGNATVIESYDGRLLCIDAGIRYDVVNRAIGYRLHECKNLLVTHLHADHAKYIDDFKKRGMEVYYQGKNIVSDGTITNLMNKDGFEVIYLYVYHTNSDGSECPCYSFLIKDKSSGEKMLWSTDTPYIQYRFNALDIYAIECNYCEQEDYINELDSIEAIVEKRRFNSHMSLQSCAEFLAKQDLSKCKEIRLLHLSHSLTAEERANIVPFIQSKIGRSDIHIEI